MENLLKWKTRCDQTNKVFLQWAFGDGQVLHYSESVIWRYSVYWRLSYILSSFATICELGALNLCPSSVSLCTSLFLQSCSFLPFCLGLRWKGDSPQSMKSANPNSPCSADLTQGSMIQAIWGIVTTLSPSPALSVKNAVPSAQGYHEKVSVQSRSRESGSSRPGSPHLPLAWQ